MSRHTFALLLVAVLSAPAAAQDRWPQFRGPGARGVSEAAGLPTRWSTTENVAWGRRPAGPRLELAGGLGRHRLRHDRRQRRAGRRTRGRPLSRARDVDPPRRRNTDGIVYALDVGTGAVRWEREVHRGAPAGGYHMKNTLATETPVTDGDSLFVYFGNLGVFCLDTTDGGLRWSRDIEPAATRLGWGTAASPVLHDGRLYIQNDNDDQSYLLALSAETGNEVWRIPRDEGTNWSTPFIWENELRTEIVTTGTDRVRSYDLDGDLLWELTGMSSITVPTPLRRVRPALSRLGVSRRPAAPGLRHPPRRQRRHLAPRVGDGQRVHRVVAGRRPRPTTRRKSSTATSCTHCSTGGSSPPTTRGPARRSTRGGGSRSGPRSPHRPGPTTTGSSR